MNNYLKQGKLRGDKTKYSDGIGYSIWYPFPDDEDSGICWDIEEADIDDAITLLIALRDGPIMDEYMAADLENTIDEPDLSVKE